MKIWITGSRGFVGKHAVGAALGAGHEVWAVVRGGAPAGDPLPEGARSLALDLDDRAAVVAEVERLAPDAILHLAWYAQPKDYLTSTENVESLATTLRFSRAVLLGGCRRMIGVGTCLEYANLPHSRSEDDAKDPRSLYARCKHAAEQVLAELFDRQGASLAWARLFHMHGPGEHPARLLASVAAALREGRSFGLSPGQQLRDHLDVRDVASALIHLAATDWKGPINVCSGQPVTLRAVMEIVGREIGRLDLLRFGERAYQKDEVMNLTGVPARLFATGWRPHIDLATGLRDTIAIQSF